MKIFPDNPTLVEIGQKYGALYMNTCVLFILSGDTKFV
jgi:hypothetical protein